MKSELTASHMLDRYFLEMRSRVLDLAAALDRIDRAVHSPAVADDPRMVKLADALRLLTDGKADRARRVQMTFSVPYVVQG